MEYLTCDILIIGGSTGATTAAIIAACKQVQTIIVSEYSNLGGMLTSAGVSAPDGNELAPWQTGLWGKYLRSLQAQEKQGLYHSWVSLYTYNPITGANIFAQWVKQFNNLKWIIGQTPKEILKSGNRLTGVRFEDYFIEAKIIIDGTELGDILTLGDIPSRWGWELQSEFNEASAPSNFNEITAKYSLQSPTWVTILQDYGLLSQAPKIQPPPNYDREKYLGAWENYGAQKFLNYGRLPEELFMINWPIYGNDYGEKVERLLQSPEARKEFLQEAYWHSQGFAHFIQQELGRRYGLAKNVFSPSGFAIHPYYRESRRLIGVSTVTEKDILPVKGGCVAPLPLTSDGEVAAIAIGNYPNDHHYPGVKFTLAPKSIRWGGRWTGTPFTIPYSALIPVSTDGLLVCEKNISVSHIANGSTRLQPVVMNIGQAAGMAAALCIELNCQPRELPVRRLQEELINLPFAPNAVIPLFNLPYDHREWLYWQRYYLDNPDKYPKDGNCPCVEMEFKPTNSKLYSGTFKRINHQQYQLLQRGKTYCLITTRPEVNQKLLDYPQDKAISLWGNYNPSGGWLLVDKID